MVMLCNTNKNVHYQDSDKYVQESCPDPSKNMQKPKSKAEVNSTPLVSNNRAKQFKAHQSLHTTSYSSRTLAKSNECPNERKNSPIQEPKWLASDSKPPDLYGLTSLQKDASLLGRISI